MKSTITFCNRVWHSVVAYFRKNCDVISKLSYDGIHLAQSDRYPRIVLFIDEVKRSSNVNVELTKYETNSFAPIVPRYSLYPIAVLDYNTEKDDLIPLVLRFTNPDTGGEILITFIYRKNLNLIGICVYDPERNYLALKYYGGYKFIVRIGVSKIGVSKIDGGKETWSCNNYFVKDGIIFFKDVPAKQGRIWITKPFTDNI